MLGVAVLGPLLLAPWNPWMLIMLLLVPACLTPSWLMLGGKKGPRLIPVLQQTGFINLGYAALFTVAVVLKTVF
jgi:1,4-dihydroxy-2-naphthoate octaprenyltransferase